ncbi:YdiU family protein [Acidaminobacter sp. JC074]|uniref:protein adenylyltransferase SelO n=1 Tax=Acidaminobacter sp. JC074 TaxID=2530199 RepID=UPI001F0DF2F0|nr:YdiU family protein [Acidaminobacter sp. JC074]MCH4891119.1 YdiU family protein [Acidaminobacter sp. JC074]
MNKIGWQYKYTYKTLPSIMFSEIYPTPVKAPEMVVLNEDLCQDLGLKSMYLTPADLSGNDLNQSQPYAQAYAGHQFGHFTILGDGRAIILGEHLTPNNILMDIQLKGSGRTRFSRSGDGRATLSSMLREYIISEAMYALNIPTTRSLAVVKSGETVMREKPNQGAILTRISKGHIRVGTFQFAAMSDIEDLKALADYSIDRLYPTIKGPEPYLQLLNKVIDEQALLIAKWQSIGFIHGVMNTDNMSIAGETIDYGPCAFMDTYHEATVYSAIDTQGRYAYKNQPIIGQWNIARFAETLMPLLDEDENKALQLANKAVEAYMIKHKHYWHQLFSKKIGLLDSPRPLIHKLLSLMQEHKLDFTNTFASLSNPDFEDERLASFLKEWRTFDIDYDLMKQTNPRVIPRNHLVDQALKAADKNDFKPFKSLMKILKDPYNYDIEEVQYTNQPQPHERVLRTYCGT